ncbi:hypothetical protein ACQ5SO_11850 [Rhodovulum sp. DZ06]|uniref:hypothetical protein n=1 Tax=Rhodovulum sp. DZ06 TaxID=3425126 RepID=UPI003D32AAAA
MTDITARNARGQICRPFYQWGQKPGADGRTNGYKCFPSGSNRIEDARAFETIEEVADWLRANPSWGVRMNPGSAIFYDGILIDGRPR